MNTTCACPAGSKSIDGKSKTDRDRDKDRVEREEKPRSRLSTRARTSARCSGTPWRPPGSGRPRRRSHRPRCRRWWRERRRRRRRLRRGPGVPDRSCHQPARQSGPRTSRDCSLGQQSGVGTNPGPEAQRPHGCLTAMPGAQSEMFLPSHCRRTQRPAATSRSAASSRLAHSRHSTWSASIAARARSGASSSTRR